LVRVAGAHLRRSSERHERLLRAFNRGLKEMARDGTLQRLVTDAGL
jgi:ABC-type amino acid transport substrate-binding protein